MNQKTKETLLARNQRIIQAVKTKADLVCPGAVDLIAIVGSFASGEYHEKSDLDLLIVINQESGWKLSKTFILEDVGHDVYCQTWEDLEHTAEYPDPHVAKLLEATIVYTASPTAENRYYLLRDRLKEVLARPLCSEDIEKAEGYYHSALGTLGKLFLSDSDRECAYQSAILLYYTEYVVYMANKSYVHHGIQGIPAEMEAFGCLPDGFADAYHKLIMAEGMANIQQAAKSLVRLTGDFLASLRNRLFPKAEIPSEALKGTYEEAFSNWRWKMYRAVQLNSLYLSLMTAASCQNYYDEFEARFQLPRFDLFAGFSKKDLSVSAVKFDDVLEEFGHLYGKVGLKICRYPTFEEFEQDYLEGKLETT